MNVITPHELAAEMTVEEADNVIGYWVDSDENKLSLYQSLIRLGDSKKLAVATAMLDVDKKPTPLEQLHYS